MEDEIKRMCKSLVEWFKVLNIPAPHSTVEELSDGVAFAQVLNQIARETFTDSWLSKMVTGSNWRLKMSNLKKVIEGLYDYYSEILNLNLNNFSKPDAMKIAEKCDIIETGRLLQLILGCAVNCSERQTYITQIMELEESLQQTIMKALQDLESIWEGSSDISLIGNFETSDVKIIQERDLYAQKCYEMEKQIQRLLDEKLNMQNEITRLQTEIEKVENSTVIGPEGDSIGVIREGSDRFNELRKNVEKLKEELLQSETVREDIKIKSKQQEQEIKTLKQKLEDAIHNNTELSRIKDELDILRETNEKLKECEIQNTIYKKKLEDHNDLKKQVKLLEERNAEYVQQIAQCEEDSKKLISMKAQIELYKKEIQELHAKIDAEMSKNVQLEFGNKNLETSIAALQRANETLTAERDTLRESIDELRLNGTPAFVSGNSVSKEIKNSELKQKIESLEAENKALREGQGGQTALAQLFDDANKRNDNLREQLKNANERILILTQSDKQKDKVRTPDDNLNLQAEINQLKQVVLTKDQEILAYETRYRKCVEKAKEIIKNIDPHISNALETNFEKPDEEKPRMSEMEEKLIASAFYRFGVNAQAEALEAKLAKLMGQGYSFLARHRQLTPRKSNQI
ncbi:protein hook [Condylostylus longicornis]|uniref:protein hook n=1 Tax=Condylostylus longicornis TaxID=2530218 RepID=UPI00244E29EA|nr:protein hook [Condylostylus longicornis]